MARNRFGGTNNDYVMGPTGAPVANVTATSVTYLDGTPCTDLQDSAGNPITLPTTDSRGYFDFQGPDDDTRQLLVDFGLGPKVVTSLVDLSADVDQLQTDVGTGGSVSQSQAQAMADAAESNAELYADNKMTTHEGAADPHPVYPLLMDGPMRIWARATFPTVAEGAQVGDFVFYLGS